VTEITTLRERVVGVLQAQPGASVLTVARVLGAEVEAVQAMLGHWWNGHNCQVERCAPTDGAGAWGWRMIGHRQPETAPVLYAMPAPALRGTVTDYAAVRGHKTRFLAPCVQLLATRGSMTVPQAAALLGCSAENLRRICHASALVICERMPSKGRPVRLRLAEQATGSSEGAVACAAEHAGAVAPRGKAPRGRATADTGMPAMTPADQGMRLPKLTLRRTQSRDRVMAALRATGPLASGDLLRASGINYATLRKLDADGATWLSTTRVVQGWSQCRFYYLDGQDLGAAVAAMAKKAEAHPRGGGRPSRASPTDTDTTAEATTDAVEPAVPASAVPAVSDFERERPLFAIVRATCDLHVPRGAWGVQDEVVITRSNGAVDRAILRAALAHPDFPYQAVTRYGLTFVRLRSDAASVA